MTRNVNLIVWLLITDYNRKRLSVNFNLSFHVSFQPQAKRKKKLNYKTGFLPNLVKKKKVGSRRKKMGRSRSKLLQKKFAGNNSLPEA